MISFSVVTTLFAATYALMSDTSNTLYNVWQNFFLLSVSLSFSDMTAATAHLPSQVLEFVEFYLQLPACWLTFSNMDFPISL